MMNWLAEVNGWLNHQASSEKSLVLIPFNLDINLSSLLWGLGGQLCVQWATCT